jgi:hypothetical protein
LFPGYIDGFLAISGLGANYPIRLCRNQQTQPASALEQAEVMQQSDEPKSANAIGIGDEYEPD